MIPKVSIIVPLYKAESNLKQCIDSILSQTIRDFELILVNDGSPDRSGDIAEEYKSKDSRVIVIHQSNQGVAKARNTGIHSANGEYIGFVDADDWIESNMYFEMYNMAKSSSADIVICGYVKGNNSKINEEQPPLNDGIYYSKDIVNKIITPMVGTIEKNLVSWKYRVMGSVWRNIFKKELLIDHNLYFNKDLSYSEDLIFCIESLLKSKKIAVINRPFYHYRISERSLSNGYRNDLFENLLVVDNNIRKLLDGKLAPEILDSRTMVIARKAIINEMNKGNPNCFIKKMKNIRKILNNDKIRDVYTRVKLKGYKYSDIFIFGCIKYKLILPLTLFYYIKNRIK
ncbi:glycosyltransferase [Caldibacillus thermoamylovorans]|uniref:glycosyltransferase n=1 Tax=Caldibacillus thermoamylovorans TaxID=35841 RepID=UPI001374AFB9|nr:glycosyltransferase [Caldibacillus thermoamylovorans]